MARNLASNRVASTRTNSILYNGDFEVKPSVLTADTTTQLRWVDGTAAGSAAKKGFGWAALAITASASVGFDTSVFRNGSSSIKLSTLNASGVVTAASYRVSPVVAASLYELIPMPANTQYTLTGYIRTNNVASSGAFIDFRTFSANGTALTTTSTAKLSGTDSTFRQVTLTVTTDATTAFGAVLLRNNVAGNTSDAWFDDITLVPTNIGRTAATGRVTP